MSSVSSEHHYRISSDSGAKRSKSREFFLQILSGKTKFPNRPMPQGRLAIGAGRDCWLQLGGPGIPEIHSWMDVGDKEISLYVFEEEPAIQVNGSKVRFARLRGGESVLIGPFEFQIQADITHEPNKPWLKPHLTGHHFSDLASDVDASLESLSVEELTNHLENEMQLVERHELRERQGLLKLKESLLETQAELALQGKELPQDLAPQQSSELHIPVNDDFVTRIEHVTRTLQERSASLDTQEDGYARAADSLLRTQERLIEQMDQLITALDSQDLQADRDDQDDERSQQAIAG